MIIHTDDYLYDGKIEKDEAARNGYIPQFVKHEAEEISAFDFLAKPFVELQQKSEAICAEMETAEDMDEVYGRYQKVLDEMDAIDAYNYDSNIRKELAIAGMTALEDASVKKISGGEFKLLSIIKSMLLKPQLLIMDEPDVFLDFENIIGSKSSIICPITKTLSAAMICSWIVCATIRARTRVLLAVTVVVPPKNCVPPSTATTT